MIEEKPRTGARKKVTPRICANCKWGEEADYFDGDFMHIECHRFPPTAISTSSLAVWPKTRPESTCGEFSFMKSPRVFEFADAPASQFAAALAS